jgi:hypothetical protein
MMFKNKLLLLVVIFLIILIGAASYLLIGKDRRIQENIQENTQTETTVEPVTVSDEEAIKGLLDKKYGNDPKTTSLTISNNEGDYAKGGYGMSDPQGGGGLWFAAKVDGNWEIVYDGNGIITCDRLNNYPNYPVSFIPECWNSNLNKMIER